MDLLCPCLAGGDIQRLNYMLEHSNLRDVHHLPNIVILKDTATVDQALKALAAARILSAPVVSVPEDPQRAPGHVWPPHLPLDNPEQLAGFIDVKDILASLLIELGGEDLQGMKMLQRVRKLEAAGATFANKMLKDLPVFGLDGELFPDSQGTASIRDLMVYFLLSPEDRRQVANLTALPHRQTHGSAATVHRVAVYSASFQIKNILSQSDLVKFLFSHRRSIGALSKKTLEELGWSGRTLITVRPDIPAIAAMALMQEKHIGAVAVVDRDGAIIGNFSMSEMRTIMAEHFGALAMPVGEFLAMEHGTDFWSISRKSIDQERAKSRSSTQGGEGSHTEGGGGGGGEGGGPPSYPVSVTASSAGADFVRDKMRRSRGHGCEVGQALVLVKPQATFMEVLEKLVKNRIHRIYIIDAASKPVGVVTCSDIIRKIVETIVES